MDNYTFDFDNRTNDNQSNEHPPVPGVDEFRYFSSAFLTALSFLGIVLNVSVIRFSRKLRRSTGDLTHSFVCSMAVADLLLCCFAQPFDFITEFLTSAKILTIPDWICRLQHMINWLGYSASGVSLTLLNLDKLIFFKWPLHYGSIDADKTALVSISASWIICSLGTIVMIVPGILKLSPKGNCDTDDMSAELYIFYTIAFCMLPVLSSALVSAYLARLVSRMQKNRTNIHSSSSSSSGGHSDSSIQQRLRAMAYIFITTAWTFAALSPFRLFNILRLYYSEAWYEDFLTYKLVSWIGNSFIFLLALNPVVDSCLTLFTYAPYKKLAKANLLNLKKLILAYCCKRCLKRKEKIEWV